MTIVEISNKFPTELHAVQHFEAIRWGKKVKCAYCISTDIGSRNADMRFHCRSCKKTFSVTTASGLHNTRLPLKTWMFAFAVITDAKKGVSAKQLERNLGLSYETALDMYHRIRGFMAIENLEIGTLDGVVEMDETFVGGKPRKFNDGKTDGKYEPKPIPKLDKRIKELKSQGFDLSRKKGNPAQSDLNPKRGRGTDQIPVTGIVERDGNVIAEVMRNLTAKNLQEMVKRHVDTDNSLLITDTYTGYSNIDRIIENVKVDHHRLYSYKGVNTNSIESFWAIVKRGIIGQYHQVSVRHLPKYVAEFVFKYNNRKVDDMFETLGRISMMNKDFHQ